MREQRGSYHGPASQAASPPPSRRRDALRAFTVVGFFPDRSAFVKPVQAVDWPRAVQAEMKASRDLQPIAALDGEWRASGTWENLPLEPPAFEWRELLAVKKRVSVFGFNLAAGVEAMHALDAEDWIRAAHYVMRAFGSEYLFVCAMDGMATVAGTWSQLLASIIHADSAAAEIAAAAGAAGAAGPQDPLAAAGTIGGETP